MKRLCADRIRGTAGATRDSRGFPDQLKDLPLWVKQSSPIYHACQIPILKPIEINRRQVTAEFCKSFGTGAASCRGQILRIQFQTSNQKM